MTKRTPMADRWLLYKPSWRSPRDRIAWHVDGLRAWALTRALFPFRKQPVGPYGWTASRIAPLDGSGRDSLALFHPKGQRAPYAKYADTPRGRRSFMWAVYRYAYDRKLSEFE